MQVPLYKIPLYKIQFANSILSVTMHKFRRDQTLL